MGWFYIYNILSFVIGRVSMIQFERFKSRIIVLFSFNVQKIIHTVLDNIFISIVR